MDDRTYRESALSRRTVLGMAASVAALGVASCGGSDEDDSAHPTVTSEAGAIAKDAYVFGFPLVLMDVARMAAEASTPVNRFEHATSLPTHAQRNVARPDPDTLHSTAWLDVTNEPMVLSVPAMEGGRFWLAQVLDAWTNNVHNPSSVRPQARSASAPFTYAVTGPGWSGALPEGLTPLPMPTPTVWLIVRIQVDGEKDLAVVRSVQERLRLVPLSAWRAGAEPPASGPPSGQSETRRPVDQVMGMNARDFFDRMCAVLAVDPPAPEDAPAMRRFAAIGIRPGGAVEGVSEGELTAAADTVKQQLPVTLGTNTVNDNGWVSDLGAGRYGTDYLLRAVTAFGALGIPLPEDAHYLFTAVPAGSGPFRLHFASGELPPVDAFWSLAVYDAADYLVANPAEIYSIGHHVHVVLNADSSLDLTLQHDDPGSGVPVGNWLPIPESDPFSVTLALFAPKAAVLQRRWQPPPLITL
ncbi:DUF1254 domain-containing protein [Nocardia gamkensis]|uniref:DUF1254 domain-containing protein n=1 Tax=Nocardia gamkensis TaxID=352869 RepID=A0A7X6R308_9NOCA|nr:DUF1254 domain-containing protein [Nocardia gamkensis]NKY26934.1 DUF1254 domain-containing protein [Nocardia gamkensis]NQE68375.1 hypothetical protein [Nocardia gamkensis]